MVGLNLGADFNAALITLAGWDQNAVDASTLSIAFLNQGGQTTIRANATANIDTGALNALIREYIPAPPGADTRRPARYGHCRPRGHHG